MRKALLCAALVAALVPATAQADIFEGSTTDATGETTPAHDIAAISARYDDRLGEVTISVQLAAPADATTDAFVMARLAKGCGGSPWTLFADRLVANPANPGVWRVDDDTTTRPLARTGTAPTITLSATHFGALAYEGYDCLTVKTQPDLQSTYDDAEITLTNVTPAPVPTTTPAPPPTPTPSPTPLGPSPLTRAERLEAALAKCTTSTCRRSARKRYGPTKGERYRAALEKCSSKACERRVKARYKGVKAAPKPTGLERRLYAHGASDIMGACGGICWEALSFVDRRYVYVGLPEGAGVPNCTRVTYDGQKKEGCATYSVRGRTVTVAGVAYTRSGNALKHDDVTLERQVFPSAGARWDVPKIEAIWVSGSPFVGTQIITKTYLTLTREGQFVKSTFSFGSSAPGVDPSIAFTSAPPDSRGTYEILPAGTIRLAYQDGKVEVGSTFFWDASKGRNPNQAGLHAIDDTFFGPPD